MRLRTFEITTEKEQSATHAVAHSTKLQVQPTAPEHKCTAEVVQADE